MTKLFLPLGLDASELAVALFISSRRRGADVALADALTGTRPRASSRANRSRPTAIGRRVSSSACASCAWWTAARRFRCAERGAARATAGPGCAARPRS
ncbi:hypothetical protein JNX00_21365 [Hydrogenophaga sp. YM1]|nr:hypothetical protein JNX00_21365 [Hydrogenophaga sp. YM1]